jgi:hypothetical protein
LSITGKSTKIGNNQCEKITTFYELHKIARGCNRQKIINSLQKYDNQSAKQCMLPAGDDCKCSWFDANKKITLNNQLARIIKWQRQKSVTLATGMGSTSGGALSILGGVHNNDINQLKNMTNNPTRFNPQKIRYNESNNQPKQQSGGTHSLCDYTTFCMR